MGKSVADTRLEEAFVALDRTNPTAADSLCRCIELAIFWKLRGYEQENLPTHVEFLSQNAQPGSVLITFNYDPLIECALDHVETVSWVPENGFGIEFAGVLANDEMAPISTQSSSDVLVLKLHGSMNWLSRASSSPSKPEYLLRLLGRDSARGSGFKCKRDPRTGQVLRPVFVPPKAAKDYESYGLTSLWRRAEKSLAAATSLTVIGYSLPSTDQAALSLLDAAAHLRDSQDVTYVTYKDREATSRFLELFPSAETFDRGFDDYVSDHVR